LKLQPTKHTWSRLVYEPDTAALQFGLELKNATLQCRNYLCFNTGKE